MSSWRRREAWKRRTGGLSRWLRRTFLRSTSIRTLFRNSTRTIRVSKNCRSRTSTTPLPTSKSGCPSNYRPKTSKTRPGKRHQPTDRAIIIRTPITFTNNTTTAGSSTKGHNRQISTRRASVGPFWCRRPSSREVPGPSLTRPSKSSRKPANDHSKKSSISEGTERLTRQRQSRTLRAFRCLIRPIRETAPWATTVQASNTLKRTLALFSKSPMASRSWTSKQ